MTSVPAPKGVMAILIVATMLLSSALIMVPTTSGEPSSPTASVPVAHDAIAIMNETDLLDQAATEGWPGTGSAADPIVIEGLDITSDASPASLYIQRVESHVLVRNCSIESTGCDGNATAVINSANLTFEGVDMVADSGFRAFSCHDIVLRNCSIIAGLEPIHEEPYTLDVDECEDITLVGCHIRESNVYTRAYFHLVDGLNLSESVIDGTCVSILGCEGARIADNTIFGIDTFGIYIYYAPGTEILRNDISDCETGILIYDTDFEPSPGMRMEGNVLNGCALLLQAGSGTLETMVMDGNVIDGEPLLFIRDTDLHGAEIAEDACEYVLYEVSNGSISDREFELINAICMVSCHNVTVRDSGFSDIRGYGVTVRECDRISVVDCDFSNTNEAVFSYADSLNLTVSGCRFFDCVSAIEDFLGTGDRFIGNTILDGVLGICSTSSIGCVIADNVINGSSDAGIVVTGVMMMGSEGTTVEGNHVSECSVGMIFSISQDSTVHDNVIWSCGEYGALILQMNDNLTFFDNVVTGCEGEAVSLGIAGEPPDFEDDANHDIILYRNAFIDNNGTGVEYDPDHVQVYTSPNDTVEWAVEEDGVLVGNHWSDLTAPDMDHDGFVDVPYRAGEDAYDMRPFASLTPYEPTSLVSAVSDGDVGLTWDAPSFEGMSEIVAYSVWRNDSGTWTRLAVVDGTGYTDVGVADGEHEYRIQAENAFGDGLCSDPLSVSVSSSSDGIDTTAVAIVGVIALAAVIVTLVLSRKG